MLIAFDNFFNLFFYRAPAARLICFLRVEAIGSVNALSWQKALFPKNCFVSLRGCNSATLVLTRRFLSIVNRVNCWTTSLRGTQSIALSWCK